jgi:DNA topoisomerase VI subunit A
MAIILTVPKWVWGKAIPPYIDKIENITSDAEFILLVEGRQAYMRMAVSPVQSGL